MISLFATWIKTAKTVVLKRDNQTQSHHHAVGKGSFVMRFPISSQRLQQLSVQWIHHLGHGRIQHPCHMKRKALNSLSCLNYIGFILCFLEGVIGHPALQFPCYNPMTKISKRTRSKLEVTLSVNGPLFLQILSQSHDLRLVG